MNSQNKWIVWVALAVVVVLVVLGLSALSGSGGVNTDNQPVLTLGSIEAGDMVRGNPLAAAVLIEYGDYQCPACASYESLVKRLSSEFGDTLAVVYRHFPLRQIHKNADISAYAAEAAGIQGKFWEMHEMLYARQSDWSQSKDAKSIFITYARGIGLDVEKFTSDIDSDVVKTKVERSFQSAVAANLPGTPTFFLNGVKLANPGSYEQFRALVGAVLAQ